MLSPAIDVLFFSVTLALSCCAPCVLCSSLGFSRVFLCVATFVRRPLCPAREMFEFRTGSDCQLLPHTVFQFQSPKFSHFSVRSVILPPTRLDRRFPISIRNILRALALTVRDLLQQLSALRSGVRKIGPVKSVFRDSARRTSRVAGKTM